MDFEIDDEAPVVEAEEDSDLTPAIADAEAAIKSADDIANPSLEDDLESVLEGLELEPEGEDSGKAKASGKAPAVDDLGLEDLDFDLDGGAKKEDLGGEEPELSLSENLDFGLEEPIPISEDVKEITEKALETASDELDLDFDLSVDDKETEPEAKEEVELSLADDFEIQPDKPKAKAAPVAKTKAPKDEELDLSDLDTLMGDGQKPGKAEAGLTLDDEFDLELEKTPAKGAPKAKGKEEALDDELDLAGLDTLIGGEEETGEEDLGLSLDEDIDFKDDFELEIDDTPPAKSAKEAKDKDAEEEELDLTGLDTLMGGGDEETAGATKVGADAVSELEDLDLDLDEEKPATIKAAKAKPAEKEIEDLSLDLDMELEEQPVAAKPAAQKPAKEKQAQKEDISKEEEIDLSDIEQMLGGEAQPEKPAEPAKAKQPEVALGGASEIDLAEIETAIDQADTSTADEAEEKEEQELELDSTFDSAAAAPKAVEEVPMAASKDHKEEELDLELEIESAGPKSGAGDTVDAESGELDLSDLSDIVEEPAAAKKSDVISSGDIELEFQVEEDATSASVATTTGRTTAGLMKPAPSARDLEAEETMESAAVAETYTPSRPKPFKPKKKKSSKALVFLLVLVLLGAIGYGVVIEAPKRGIEIPYINDYLNPKPKDPSGTIKLATLDINSKFIENSQAGRLFIITGKVRNGYNMSRNNIRMQGRLFTKGKVIAKTEYSYAGIMINDQDLASLPIAEIKQRLNAAAQPQETAGSARPGQSIPFMVVFSELPPMDQLDEFAVEIVSSTPGQ
ncbi:MAG: DUF3426 domain-containing protein [Desulfobacteraceae bacterium]|nr:DUF3426 domain-containing protein [Desulfobacteraceae bacterium]